MGTIKRLPDAEFELMKVVWRGKPGITTSEIIDGLGAASHWKPQTVLTMLTRLIEKGFLTSERVGRQRNYTAAVDEAQYMSIETGGFMSRYRGNSVGSLVKTMYAGKDLSAEDIEELRTWLDQKVKEKG
ncbi:MAG: BlaI/MecI/CopY family transcriptional regulator [Coriobacteriia bacterium]|nr:BlaI/MecI/CopY family transcriptional regulator [Coriobacteriia bacterium]MCL2537299.1 BlaI/MecI/CopY family transcriptional regulator [Coriobacteriia bacterium]